MPTFTRGSTVYLRAKVVDKLHTELAEATLDGAVEFSLDGGATWDAGDWEGDAFLEYDDTERKSLPHRIARRTTLWATDDTTEPLDDVRVKVGDSPEVYVIAGLRATFH